MDEALAMRTERFLDHCEAAHRRWRWEDTDTMRYAALVLAFVPGGVAEVEESLAAIAEEIRRRSSFFSSLRGMLRFGLAAMLLRRRRDPGAALEEAESNRHLLEEAGLGTGPHAILSAFLMLPDEPGGGAGPEIVARARAIYDRMKARHRFLTGREDVPMAVALARGEDGVEAVDARLEALHRALVEGGAGRSNATQRAALVLAVGRADPAAAPARFHALRERFARAGLPHRGDAYDEAALLALLPESAVDLEGLAALTEVVRGKRWLGPSKGHAFSVAVRLYLSALGVADSSLGRALDAEILEAVEEAVEAHEAGATIVVSA